MESKLTISTPTIRLSLGWLMLISTTAYLTRYSGELSGHGSTVAACSLILLCAWGLLFYASANIVRKSVIQPDKIAAGVLNDRAIRLPDPEFPIEAKAAQATGAVNVEVLVNESGNVIAAQAVSGHPLLRKPAVAAATLTIFKPMKIQQRYVKVAGTLVYDFSPRLSVMQIGVRLSAAKESGELEPNFPAIAIGEFLPADWEDEQEHIQQIVDWQEQMRFDSELSDDDLSENDADFDFEDETSWEEQIIIDSELLDDELSEDEADFDFEDEIPLSFTTENYLELLESLIELLQQRFSEDEIENWSFALGLNLGKIDAHFENEIALRQNLIELNQITDDAPAEVTDELLDELHDLTAHADDGDFNEDDKEKIKNFLLRVQ